MADQSPHTVPPGTSIRHSRPFSFRRLRRWFERLGRSSRFDADDEAAELAPRKRENDGFENYRSRLDDIQSAAINGAPPDALFKPAYDAYRQGQAQYGTGLGIGRNKLKAQAERLDAQIDEIVPPKRKPTLAEAMSDAIGGNER